MRIVPLEPDDWQKLQEIRLNALRDSPDAFITDGHEFTWREADWRRSATTASWVIVEGTDGTTIAVARSNPDGSRDERHLEAVWVDPRYRRRGVATWLVLSLVKQELEAGIEHILIWVIDSNHAGRQLYEGLGFKPTGEVQPIQGRRERVEERLKLPIEPGFPPEPARPSSL